MIKRIRAWYDGTHKTIEHNNDPSSGVWFMPTFVTEYHWTARVAHALVDFYLRHWQWLWTTVIAVGGLMVSVYLALRDHTS
jgi:hypothetical protein